MYTFIGPVQLAILLHHHHNNIHNNIDNNNNNTVSAMYSQKKSFRLPTPTEVALFARLLYPTLQAVYTTQKATLSNNLF